MKQCPNCGNSCSDNDEVCGFCGQQLNSSATDNINSATDNIRNTVNSNLNSAPDYQSNVPLQQKTNSYAIASIVLGIVSVPLLCCCVGVITAILAIIFGFIARNKIALSNGYESGNGLALAGIITGFAVIGIALVLVVVSLATSNSVEFWEQFQNEMQRQIQQNS